MRHGNNGKAAEKRVIDKYGLERADVEWCDATNPRTGARYEVKSASTSATRPRFRLWEDQHRSLTRAANHAAAWYVFVYGGEMTRRRPSTVTEVVNDRGGWNRSGHRRGARQLKVPVEELL